MPDKSKLTLPFLALPFVAFFIMISDGFIAGLAPRFALPVQGYDPRDMLYGHYMNIRVNTDIIKNTNDQGCACIKPSASKEKVGYQNAVLYMSCKDTSKDSCIAVLDSSNTKLFKTLSEPVHMYVEETLAPELEQVLRTTPQRLEVDASIRHGNIAFHQLLLDGKPVKSKTAPDDPFNLNIR